jgi:hypothetical protein
MYHHSDDLPDQDVRELPKDDPRYDNFKCQGNYIAGLGLDLQFAMLDIPIVDGYIRGRIKEVTQNMWSYMDGGRTTKKEIQLMDSVLDDVIEHLQMWRSR